MPTAVIWPGAAQAIKRRVRRAAPNAVIVEQFLGPAELAQILSKTRLNVHPATHEAFGMTIVEAASQVWQHVAAMSCGCWWWRNTVLQASACKLL